MTTPTDDNRAALQAWFQDARPDLERKDWRAAFGARYPRLNLENARCRGRRRQLACAAPVAP